MTPEQQRLAIAKASGDGHHHLRNLPDYLNDLHAVREVVKTLNSRQREEYILRLCNGDYWKSVELNIEDAIFAESAPPEQRSEALLKTLKLWEESK